MAKSTNPDFIVSDNVNWYIDRALEVRRAEKTARENRDYVGMSEVGDNCLRRIYLHRIGVQGPPLDGYRLRAFEIGDRFELMLLEWMIAAGFQLITRNKSGEQFEFEAAQGRIKGHIDGVIANGPPIPNLTYPAIWEGKALKNKSWNAIVKSGIEKAEPKYHGQQMQYMTYGKLPNSLFSMINKDTSDVYHIVIPFNEKTAQKYIDNSAKVLISLDKGMPPPRISANSDFFKCKQCHLHDACWAMPT